MALLTRIQGMLENTYDLEMAYNVYDFITTDRKILASLSTDNTAEVTEKLLIVETTDGLDVALYLDENLLQLLHRDDPLETLHDGNLDTFWTVLEGISHFTLFAWSAGYDREVRLLEMELQAEIDKFVSALMLVGHQHNSRVPAALHQWLFDNHSYCESLTDTERERYRSANHYAGQYCRALQSRFLDGRKQAGLITELRRFYRLPQNQKIRHIETAVAG